MCPQTGLSLMRRHAITAWGGRAHLTSDHEAVPLQELSEPVRKRVSGGIAGVLSSCQLDTSKGIPSTNLSISIFKGRLGGEEGRLG